MRPTPFGFRLGQAAGPHTFAAGETLPLVANPLEQGLLALILELVGEGPNATLGQRAYRAARALNHQGLTHPRTGKPWHVGSIKGLVQTARRKREHDLQRIFEAAVAPLGSCHAAMENPPAKRDVSLGSHPPSRQSHAQPMVASGRRLGRAGAN